MVGGSAPKPCLKHPQVHTALYVETLVHARAAVPIYAGMLHVSLFIHTGVFRHIWAHHTHVGTHRVPYTPPPHTYGSINTWPHLCKLGYSYRSISTYQHPH